MSIVTKKGDKGETSLFGSGEKLSKSNLIFSIIGTIDEVSSHLGLAVSLIDPKLPHKNIFKNKIEQVQKSLFELGSMFAGAKISVPNGVTAKYEKEIHVWQKTMPERKNFIFPGGSATSAELFIARSVVRRLEREIVAFSKIQNVKPGNLVFINRLSDYLYVLARYINFSLKVREKAWRGKTF